MFLTLSISNFFNAISKRIYDIFCRKDFKIPSISQVILQKEKDSREKQLSSNCYDVILYRLLGIELSADDLSLKENAQEIPHAYQYHR